MLSCFERQYKFIEENYVLNTLNTLNNLMLKPNKLIQYVKSVSEHTINKLYPLYGYCLQLLFRYSSVNPNNKYL